MTNYLIKFYHNAEDENPVFGFYFKANTKEEAEKVASDLLDHSYNYIEAYEVREVK